MTESEPPPADNPPADAAQPVENHPAETIQPAPGDGAGAGAQVGAAESQPAQSREPAPPHLHAKPRAPRPPSPPSRVKKYLTLGILVAIVLLSGAIVVRVIIGGKPPAQPLDVQAAWQAAFELAKGASKAIFDAEKKTWVSGESLKPEDYSTLRDQVKILRESHKKLDDLRILIEPKGESQDAIDIGARLLLVKLWILDADDAVESENNPAKQPGLYIPMFTLINRWRDAQKELQEFEKTKADLAADPAKKAKARARVRELRKTMVEIAEKLGKLDDYVKEGLARDDLTATQLPDLGTVREEQSLVGQAIKIARDLLAEFRE